MTTTAIDPQVEYEEITKLLASRNTELDQADAILASIATQRLVINSHRETAAQINNMLAVKATDLRQRYQEALRDDLRILRSKRKGIALEKLDFYSPQMHLWAGPDGWPIDWVVIIENPYGSPFGHCYGVKTSSMDEFLQASRFGRGTSDGLIPSAALTRDVITQIKIGQLGRANLFLRVNGQAIGNFQVPYLNDIRAFNYSDLTIPMLDPDAYLQLVELASDPIQGRTTTLIS